MKNCARDLIFSLLLAALLNFPAQLNAANSAQDYYAAAKQVAASGDYARAKLYLEATVKLDPNHWQAWQELGNTCARLRLDKEALTAYERSLAVNPDNPPLATYVAKIKKQSLTIGSPPTLRATPLPLQRPERKPLQRKRWEKKKEYIANILLKPNKYVRQEVCYQWANPPSLSIIGGNKKQDLWVYESIEIINEILRGTRMQLIKQPKDDETADILFHIIYANDFDMISKKHNFRTNSASLVALAMETIPEHAQISNAAVFIPQDYGEDRTRLASLVFLYQILGVRNFWLEVKSRQDVELSDDDKELLRFFYTFIKPGDDQAKVEDAFGKYYPELKTE